MSKEALLMREKGVWMHCFKHKKRIEVKTMTLFNLMRENMRKIKQMMKRRYKKWQRGRKLKKIKKNYLKLKNKKIIWKLFKRKKIKKWKNKN